MGKKRVKPGFQRGTITLSSPESTDAGNGIAMSRIFHPLMYLLACATRQDLGRQIQYLKTENEILQSKLPKRITGSCLSA